MILFVFCTFLIIFINGGDNQRKLSSMKGLIKTVAGVDIMSNAVTGISTVELIQMFHDSSLQIRAYTKSIAQELKQRMAELDEDNLEQNKQILFEVYEQCINGKQVLQSAQERISEIVRIKLQQIINQRCGRMLCVLTAHGQTAAFASNKLLKVLDYFGKSIVVPDHVKTVLFGDVGLTSLWLKFGQHSNIQIISLRDSNFEEVNHGTFGRFIHERARQNIRSLSLKNNPHISEIDFDELMIPNIEIFSASRCDLLTNTKNIPESMQHMSFEHSGIKTGEQLQFKEREGNNLISFECDAECLEEFKNVLTSLHPEREFECYIYNDDQEQSLALGYSVVEIILN